MAENAEQKRLFTEALQKQCGDEDKERTQFLTERKYEQVCAGLDERRLLRARLEAQHLLGVVRDAVDIFCRRACPTSFSARRYRR